MSQPRWLPPLNFHTDYKVAAVASQEEYPTQSSSSSSDPKFFVIETNVTVYYYPDNETNMGSQHLEGLNLTRKFTIPCSQLTSPTDSLLTITLLLREMNIPFDLYRDIFFVDIHLEEDLRVLGDAGDHLLAKIREFACDMMLKPYNVGHNVLPMNLRILRYVRIPPVQYFAWESWFAKENESPCFGQAYKNAISRPRTKRELKYGINPENDDEVTNLAVLLSLGRKMMDLNLSN